MKQYSIKYSLKRWWSFKNPNLWSCSVNGSRKKYLKTHNYDLDDPCQCICLKSIILALKIYAKNISSKSLKKLFKIQSTKRNFKIFFLKNTCLQSWWSFNKYPLKIHFYNLSDPYKFYRKIHKYNLDGLQKKFFKMIFA